MSTGARAREADEERPRRGEQRAHHLAEQLADGAGRRVLAERELAGPADLHERREQEHEQEITREPRQVHLALLPAHEGHAEHDGLHGHHPRRHPDGGDERVGHPGAHRADPVRRHDGRLAGGERRAVVRRIPAYDASARLRTPRTSRGAANAAAGERGRLGADHPCDALPARVSAEMLNEAASGAKSGWLLRRLFLPCPTRSLRPPPDGSTFWL